MAAGTLPVRVRVPLSIVLTTPRLILRPLRLTDAVRLRLFRRTNEEHLRPWSPRPPPGVPLDSLVEITRGIEQNRIDWREDRSYRFAAFLNGAVVGRVGLNNVVRGAFQNADVGYVVGAAQEGHGLAREAVREVCAFGFERAGLHRIQAGIRPTNERSLKL